MARDRVSGIHHITAIASDPQRSLDFYTQVIGLRLVKLTFNFDDSGTYHLYFGDDICAPGTILTFFPWPYMPQGKIDTGQVVTIAFEVPVDALDFWTQRLRDHAVDLGGREDRFGDDVVRFRDPDGLWLELVGVSRAVNRRQPASSVIPPGTCAARISQRYAVGARHS